MDSHEIGHYKHRKLAIGYKVEFGTANSVGSHEDPTLPKQSNALIPMGVFRELDNCDTSINPAAFGLYTHSQIQRIWTLIKRVG
jgi:hypothetical protein